MFVGQTGVSRVVKRTCEVMNEHPGQDVREYGALPLEVIQKYVSRWSSSSLDLFGAEVSSNAARCTTCTNLDATSVTVLEAITAPYDNFTGSTSSGTTLDSNIPIF